MKPNEPTTFDHRALAVLPEYHAFRKALDDLLNAAHRADHPVQVETITEAVTSSYAADYCDCCRDLVLATPPVNPTCWPHAAEVDGGWLHGSYRCPRTGRTWTCGWSTNAEALQL